MSKYRLSVVWDPNERLWVCSGEDLIYMSEKSPSDSVVGWLFDRKIFANNKVKELVSDIESYQE